MADPLTTNVGLAVPTRGSDVGTWDVPVNGDFTLIDAMYGSVTTKTLSNANITLTATEAQVAVIRFTGTITTNIAVFIPATIIKGWVFENFTTGNFYVAVTLGGVQLGLPPGLATTIYSNGTVLKYASLFGPIGSYLDISTSVVPLWILGSSVPPYLNCDGSTYNTTTYPYLNALLGSNVLPDSRGRSRFTIDQSTNRITSVGSGIAGNSLLAVGGSQNRVIIANNLPQLAVQINDPGHQHGQPVSITSPGSSTINVIPAASDATAYAIPTTLVGTGITATANPAGTNGSFVVMPPTYIGGLTLIRAA